MPTTKRTEYYRKYYANRIHTDPIFYEEEKRRNVEYAKIRYATDEAFRHKRLLQQREYYKRKKSQLSPTPSHE